MKEWWKSKTIWFNIICATLVALEGAFAMLQPLLPMDVYAVLATTLTVGNAVLRVITTQGIKV